MQAVTGFLSQTNAEEAVRRLESNGVPSERVTLLTPGGNGQKLESLPVDTTEQPGMGDCTRYSVRRRSRLVWHGAIVPGVGTVTAIGLLGAAVLTATGASLGPWQAVRSKTQ
jgi:hypothetical protein